MACSPSKVAFKCIIRSSCVVRADQAVLVDGLGLVRVAVSGVEVVLEPAALVVADTVVTAV